MILEKSWWSFLVVVVSIVIVVVIAVVIAVVIVVRGHSYQFSESNLSGMRGHRGPWPNLDLQPRLHLLSARNALMVRRLYRLEHCL